MTPPKRDRDRSKTDLLEELKKLRRKIDEQQKKIETCSQSEEELKEKTTFINKIIDSSALSLWISDEKGTATRTNPACLKFFGATEEEVIGKYNLFKDVVIEQQGYMPEIRRVFEKGEVASIVIDYDFGAVDHVDIKNPTHKIVNSIFTPVLDKNGKVTNVIVQAVDLTDIIRAKEELSRSKILLESSIESPRDMNILSLDHRYRYLYFNKTHAGTMKQIYGTQPRIGDCIFDHIKGKDDIKKLKSHYDRAITGEGHVAIEEYGKGQERRHYEIQYNPIYDEKNKIIGITSFSRDITKRRQAEDELKKLASVVRYSSELINLSDLNGRMIFLNNAGSRILGIDIENVKNVNIMDVIPDHLQSLVKNDLLPTLLSNRVWKGELQYVNLKTGTLTDVNAVTFLITDTDTGAPLYFANVSHDITEKKLAEETLKKSEEQIRQIQKLEGIGQLAGGIAHDFNNILTAIIGNTELALKGLEKGKNIRSNLDQVMFSGMKAGELVQQILAFSRRQIIQPKIIDVNAAASELSKTLRRLIKENIKIEMKLHHDKVTIMADPTQLEQVLINLTVNAQDAINQKRKRHFKKKIKIEISKVFLDEEFVSTHVESTTGPHVLITVSDNGIGMNRDVIKKSFEPFFTTKAKGKGTGLGLSTVYGIVKQNKGYINVYSEKGEGTTFKIYWPAITDDTEEGQKAKKEKVSGGNETILIAEDDKMVRMVFKKYLTMYGYKVLMGTNGKHALDLVKNKSAEIDMLITDLVMPRMDGIELAEKLRKIFPRLKVLYCSGYPDSFITSYRGILKENFNFVSKPCTGDTLVKKVREILDG